MTVTPNEEVLAGGTLRPLAGRQIPRVTTGMGAPGRGEELLSKCHRSLACLGRPRAGLERSAGIADRESNRFPIVSGDSEPALQLLKKLQARRGQGHERRGIRRRIRRYARAAFSR
jgi:hypothetical protein